MSMTPREIVRETLAFRRPPYVPWSFRFTREAREKLQAHFGTEDIESHIGNHILELGSDIGFFTELGNDRHRDVFGVVWNRSVDKDIGNVEGQVLPKPSLDGYKFPDPLDPRFFQDIPERIALSGERYRLFCLGFSLFERAWTLRGLESLYMDFIENPDFVHELFAAIADYNIAQVKKALEYDIDAVYFGDDWGQQHGLLMGYDFWKEFIYPQIKRMYGVVREAGKNVFIHSCGDVDELFEDLISLGLGVFNPFQPEVMEVDRLMAEYRGRLAFWGGVSTQRTMPFGTPEEVRGEVRKMRDLGREGGYILSPSHALEGDVSLENLLALIEEAQASRGPGEKRSCPFHHQSDPFGEARRKDGILVNEFQGNPVPMILRHNDLRQAAKDWQIFSSDAPRRIPIPSEEEVRTVRQLPLEVDPPVHADYREVAEPFFNRAKLPEVITRMEGLVRNLIADALGRDAIEIVREFAIPLQSRALACLLNMPEAEADVWIGWGTHVFREGDGSQKGAALEVYMNQLFDRAEEQPGEDFFTALTRAKFRGRNLTREEMLGFGSITFAGGRDTVINSISGVIGHLAANPADFNYLKEDPKRIVHASEEFFRAISPVTHIGRVCPAKTEIHGVSVAPGALVSLCFASANYDETVFPSPEEVRLDRKPNPHVAFGFGTHLCLGAAHARLIVRSLLKCLCEQVSTIATLGEEKKVEREERYNRRLAYESLNVRFSKR